MLKEEFIKIKLRIKTKIKTKDLRHSQNYSQTQQPKHPFIGRNYANKIITTYFLAKARTFLPNLENTILI